LEYKRKRATGLFHQGWKDFSWHKSAKEYLKLYKFLA